jgi:hypothetical protein
MSLNVQTVLNDALALAGITADGLDAGDPDPQHQTRALSCLQMLLGEWATELTINNNTRTYTVTPQHQDYILIGMNDTPVNSSVLPYVIPSTGLIQLPNTNIATPATPAISVVNLHTRVPYIITTVGVPNANQCLVDPYLGTLTFNASEATQNITVSYSYFQDTNQRVDIFDTPMDVEAVSFELGGIVFPCTKVSYRQYQQMSLKQNVTAIPSYFAWDYQYPIGRLYVWPQWQPSMTARITVTRMILEPRSQGTIDLPGFYRKALTYIATMLYTFYPTGGLDQEVIWHAKASLEGIKKRNRRMHMPKAVSGYSPGIRFQSLFTSPGAPRIGG